MAVIKGQENIQKAEDLYNFAQNSLWRKSILILGKNITYLK